MFVSFWKCSIPMVLEHKCWDIMWWYTGEFHYQPKYLEGKTLKSLKCKKDGSVYVYCKYAIGRQR